jgi:thiol-disulfide isomerase/thioredoxin
MSGAWSAGISGSKNFTRASMRPPTLIAIALIALIVSSGAKSDEAGTLDLNAYAGKVVYLDFWASWCAPCRLSFPWLNAMEEALGPRGLVVIGVNVDHDHGPAEEFLRENAANFRIVYDPEGRIARKYGLQGMPTSVLIGRDGKVHSTHSGFFREREGGYFADVSALVNKGP